MAVMEALREWTKRTMAMRDTEGRPLGEAKVPPEQRSDLVMELRTCPYAGSRHNHARPMNVSALKQMLAHWQEALGGIALLRSLYGDQARQQRLRLIDVWRIAGLTSAVADFAFLRAWQPIADGALPAAVAVLYKVPLGVSLTTSAMWEDGAARFDAIVDADALYEYADQHGHFIGPRQVCGGPVAMVKEVLRLMVDGTGPQGDPSAAAAVIGDRARFLRFAHGAASLALLAMALNRLDAGMGFDLADALAGDRGGPRLSQTVRRNVRMARYHGYDARAWPDVLDELFTHAADPLFAAADLGPAVQAIREAWGRPLADAGEPIRRLVAASPQAGPLLPTTRAAVEQHLARFCAVEHGFAALVRLLKVDIADAVGVEQTTPQARELHLVDYVPSGIRLTRSILRDALGIEVHTEGGTPVLTCGNVSCAPLAQDVRL
jgi:hypothetical protein